MRTPPLYICPDCEGHGTLMYAGRVILKRCSKCEHDRRHARTGADRCPDPWSEAALQRGISEDIRRIFGGGR